MTLERRPASLSGGKKMKQVSLFDVFGPKKKNTTTTKVDTLKEKEPKSSVDDKSKNEDPVSITSSNGKKEVGFVSSSQKRSSSKAQLSSQKPSPKEAVKSRTRPSSSSSRLTSKEEERQRRREALEDTDDDEEREWQEEEKGKQLDSESEFEAEEPEEEEDFICDGEEGDDDEDMEDEAPARKKRKTIVKPNSSTTPMVKSTPGKMASDLSLFARSKITPTPNSAGASLRITSLPKPRSLADPRDNSDGPTFEAKVSVSPSTFSLQTSSSTNTETPQVAPTPPMFVNKALNPLGSHVHHHLKFLNPPKDSKGRSPDHPEYDGRTLRIVHSDWEKVTGEKMTDATLQWWELKSQYFDTVLLFKSGKFYNVFHMDADIAVKVLGISMMKGHVAQAGFPEKCYGAESNRLIKAGYKVARIEQTETPEMLASRKKLAKKGNVPKVVNREMCSILTLGTRTCCYLDGTNEEQAQQVGPLLAIAERSLDGDDLTGSQDACLVREFGVTLVDAPRGWVTIGQFRDDPLCSQLQTLLAAHRPSEFLYQEGTEETQSSKKHLTLKSLLAAYRANSLEPCRMEIIRSTESFPKSTALDPSVKKQLERPSPTHPWSVEETIQELTRREYFKSKMPLVLRDAIQHASANQLALASYGAVLYTLQRHLIDTEILSMGVVLEYASPTSTFVIESLEESPQTNIVNDSNRTGSSTSTLPKPPLVDAMLLEGTTLHNLEVVANASDGKITGSLWSKLGHTKTPHGSRLLKAWLLRPLFEKSKIDRRADAVQELASGSGAFSCKLAQNVLSKCGDIERLLSRVHSMSGVEAEDGNNGAAHPNQRAVLYEEAEYTKRKVGDFSKVLNGLKQAAGIPAIFHDMEISSPLLENIVRHPDRGGCFPDIENDLSWFFENFDCDKAAQGLFEPSAGIDALFDEAIETKERILADLEQYKVDMCQALRSNATLAWKYINTGDDSKDKYLIELPASIKVPNDWHIAGKRGKGPKQVNKYTTSVVVELVEDLEKALEVIARRKLVAVQLIFARFDSKRDTWAAVATATAMLDALCSLAVLASQPGYTRAQILEYETHPIFSCRQARHPCVENNSISSEFIPNDLELGTEQGPELVLLLSGPNMGGKSTFLRQTCLIAILAQIGSFVPAEECRMTPIDRIYTRLGASDRILLGQSTFFVELSETASALRGATNRSLVIMDELGRGTSTFDGNAIANAAVKHLVEQNKCLALFATHYHNLLDDWSHSPLVRLGHMECFVENDEADGLPSRVTFLYTLGKGSCPKSFGINVARLAGLPNDVLLKAAKISREFEKEMNAGSVRARVEEALKNNDLDLVRRLWQELSG